MPPLPRWFPLRRGLLLLGTALLTGCAIAPPRNDDPYEKFNRKMYTFNDKLDKAIIRPVAVGYRKITNKPVRNSLDNFFSEARLPISIGNNILQGKAFYALQNTGRFLVNLTFGLGGFFDPASKYFGLPLEESDFGVTLARWGLPEGPFLELPFFGPASVRDAVGKPVDAYFLDPLSRWPRHENFKDGQYYVPGVVYLITLRSQLIDAEGFLNSAYDPYAFFRDTYRQHRLSQIYYGNPPDSAVQQLQGANNDNIDPDKLLDEQHQWEQQHSGNQ